MHHLLGRRVGLLKVATLGQLTAAQLKNASNILDVISGMCQYIPLTEIQTIPHTTRLCRDLGLRGRAQAAVASAAAAR
jgi:hypothetical protein